jgi:hypothetical protein
MNTHAVANRAPQSTLTDWLYALISAIPLFCLAYVLFQVWIDPLAWDNGRWVPYGVGLLVLEFLVLHSSAFISAYSAKKLSPTENVKIFAGLFVFYLLMAVGIALSTQSLDLLWVLAAIMVSRFIQAWRATPQAQKNAQARSAFGICLYLAVVAGTVFIDLPAMGITQEVLDSTYPSRGGGIWEKHPQRAIAGGGVYFAVLGVAELTFLRAKASTETAIPS